MMLLQSYPDLINALIAFFLDNIITYVFGLVTLFLYFLVRPRASFWFAKKKLGIFRRGLQVNMESLLSFNLQGLLPDEGVKALAASLDLTNEIECGVIKSSSGERLEVVVSLPERKMRFDGVVSVDEEFGEVHAMKLKCFEVVAYGNLANYVESIFTARDLLHKSVTRSLMPSSGLPKVVISVLTKPNRSRQVQWLDFEHEFDGIVNIPAIETQIHRSPGCASVSAVTFHSVLKEIVQNLVVESTLE